MSGLGLPNMLPESIQPSSGLPFLSLTHAQRTAQIEATDPEASPQGPLLVPFISPYSRHGVWDVGSGCYWLLGCQAHLCLRSASTVHSVGQRTCWDSPTLFPLLPWPLGSASPSPRVGKEQASLPSCRTASTGSCSKSLADSTTPRSLFYSSNYFCNIFSRKFTRPRLKAKVFS